MKSNLLNDTFHITMAGITGTAAMTLYSYVLSVKKDENFKEPVLLAEMIYAAVPDLKKKNANTMGWILHFCVGVFFSFCYKAFLKREFTNHPAVKGLAIGALTGIVAVFAWRCTFWRHPNPPKINYRKFYGQLITSHAIFGFVTIMALCYKKSPIKRVSR